jgi:hypothetical protein
VIGTRDRYASCAETLEAVPMTPRSPIMPAVGSRPRPGSVPPGRPARLPWWALALPAVAFAALLTVVLLAGRPATAGSAQPLIELAGCLRDLLVRALTVL